VEGRVGGELGDVAFTIEIDNDGDVTVTQYLSLEHGDPLAEDEAEQLATGAVIANLTVTDGDDDVAVDTADLSSLINFEDDAPLAFSPAPVIIANSALASGVADLDVFGNTGVDGLATAIFSNGSDGDQLFEVDGITPVTSDDEPLYMYGFGTDTLEIYTLDGDDNPDVLVMTITLNPNADIESDDLYTVTIHQPIDDGSGFVFDDFSDTAAGNNQWVGVDADGGDIMADLNDSQDLLITAPGDEVNTDSDDIGVANQWTDPGEIIRLDFVTDLRRDAGQDEKDFQGYTYDDHYAVNNFSLKVIEVQGGGTATLGFKVYDFNDDDHDKDLAAGSTQLAILLASIVVIAADGVTILTEGVDYEASLSPDGKTIFVSGLDAGETVSFDGISDFESVEVFNASGMPNPDLDGETFSGSPFSVGAFGFDSAVAGEDVPMEFNVELTDGDGDTSNGTIAVTTTPDDGVIMGTVDSEAVVGSNGDDILIGMAGDDILTGGLGDDIFKFNMGDEGTLATPAADIITDFNANGESDSIDLRDILDSETYALTGDEVTGGNILNYLSVQEVGSDVVISVSHNGSGDVTQTITLQNTSFTDLGVTGASQAEIVGQLLANGSIQADQS
jgi:hypothetical protein